MSERTLRLASAVLATAGAAITAYLLHARLTDTNLICATGGCETVQNSPYAELFGVPVAALGLVAFLGLLVAALARSDLARLVQAALALSALMFSAYLVYVQLVVIEAVCQWCLATDLVTTGIAALALLRVRLGAATAV
jgi:uncharacterized membrane protein